MEADLPTIKDTHIVEGIGIEETLTIQEVIHKGDPLQIGDNHKEDITNKVIRTEPPNREDPCPTEALHRMIIIHRGGGPPPYRGSLHGEHYYSPKPQRSGPNRPPPDAYEVSIHNRYQPLYEEKQESSFGTPFF